jgi:hypothetical protein
MAWYYQHRDLVLPSDDTVIWRYMDLPKFRDMLRRTAIFFSRADMQSDKLEGEYPPAMVEELEKRFKGGMPSIDGVRRTFLQWHWEKEIPSRLISCWSAGPRESRRKWSQHTRRKESVAIRSTVERLKKCFNDKTEDPVVWIGQVRYGEEENRLPRSRFRWDANFMLYPFFAKKEDYRWESEIRATANIALLQQSESKGSYVKADLRTLIDSLWVHPQASARFRDSIARILAESEFDEVGVNQSSWDDLPE